MGNIRLKAKVKGDRGALAHCPLRAGSKDLNITPRCLSLHSKRIGFSRGGVLGTKCKATSLLRVRVNRNGCSIPSGLEKGLKTRLKKTWEARVGF